MPALQAVVRDVQDAIADARDVRRVLPARGAQIVAVRHAKVVAQVAVRVAQDVRPDARVARQPADTVAVPVIVVKFVQGDAQVAQDAMVHVHHVHHVQVIASMDANHVEGVRIIAQMAVKQTALSTVVGLAEKPAQRVAKVVARRVVWGAQVVVARLVGINALMPVPVVRAVQDVKAVARHPAPDALAVHPVPVDVNRAVVDVQAVQAVHTAVNPVQALAMGRVRVPVIVNARDARPLVQARAMMLVRLQMKRRPSPIWAVISASEI